MEGGVWTRKDAQDTGPMYRNVIGIPGGVNGPLYPVLVAANVHGMQLQRGSGPADTHGEGVVYVYDSEVFPFYRGEQYHQFHKNVVLRRAVPSEYLDDAAHAATERGWIEPTCEESGATSPATSNVVPSSCEPQP